MTRRLVPILLPAALVLLGPVTAGAQTPDCSHRHRFIFEKCGDVGQAVWSVDFGRDRLPPLPQIAVRPPVARHGLVGHDSVWQWRPTDPRKPTAWWEVPHRAVTKRGTPGWVDAFIQMAPLLGLDSASCTGSLLTHRGNTATPPCRNK